MGDLLWLRICKHKQAFWSVVKAGPNISFNKKKNIYRVALSNRCGKRIYISTRTLIHWTSQGKFSTPCYRQMLAKTKNSHLLPGNITSRLHSFWKERITSTSAIPGEPAPTTNSQWKSAASMLKSWETLELSRISTSYHLTTMPENVWKWLLINQRKADWRVKN